MLRIPWWIKAYIREKIPINPKTAEQKKLYWSIAYAVSAFIAFNCVVYTSRPKGVSKEDDKLLTEAEKVIIRLNAPNIQYIKYKVGEGVVTNTSVSSEDMKTQLEERKL
ncbi:uncharacterized protein LOC103510924 [Diaphorina citri]|uniref:Uncharacterized protein LOC103510924 n=1 Tax=Diaphorina citri TaxID=121845 RepID=A0A1S3D3X4_DIACI|nr:uncharacterized protein LOC103510924 [Diaphorina citri]XP_008473850.1 uncharacterized protein LOC103510924 [Diaphorina citri]KAI5705942.1 hypothetical protein M8J75_003292 [Diaphorina citri]KAI5741452.1 hypothetical protein M8J76_013764 [Diaphorina citri]KAI5748118.1 hypothetical protein M8J77_022000 [Diaphorina citri]